MKYMRRTAGYIWTDYKTNAQIAKELKITPILDKLLEYERNWLQHVNRMPRNRLPRVRKRYSPTGRRNHGRPLKRLLDTWDRTGQQVAQLHDRYRIYNSFTIKLCSHGWYIWQIFVTLGNLPCLFLTDCQEMWNQSRELPLFVCISIQDLFFAFPWLIYTW